jgi:hypothetical protein
MYSATILDVLIASPSDTVEQREVIRQAVINWNSSNSRFSGVVLLPVMWETHSIPDLSGRPQGIINDQLVDDADILIATFWTKLGTPTGEADSGTAEEINRFCANSRPVHVYFCETPVRILDTDRAQVEAMAKYLEELKRRGLLSTYGTNEELRLKVRDDLTKRIHDMQQKGLIERPSTTITVQKSDSDQMHANESETVDRLEMIRKSLRGHLASWEATIRGFNDYNVDQRHDLMRMVARTLLDMVRQVASHNPDSPTVSQLSETAAKAIGWSQFRIYLDGGTSFNALSDGCREVVDEVSRVVDQTWS